MANLNIGNMKMVHLIQFISFSIPKIILTRGLRILRYEIFWNWRSSTKDTKIDKSKSISSRRKEKYKKPNTTERRGLVTSRVGQGYYRRAIK